MKEFWFSRPIHVRHLLPTSNIDILVHYLFSRHQFWVGVATSKLGEGV